MAEKQKVIEGTCDTPTKRVEIAGEVYCRALYVWKEAQTEADESRKVLIELMEADNIESFQVDDEYEVKLVTSSSKKVRVKKLSGDEE